MKVVILSFLIIYFVSINKISCQVQPSQPITWSGDLNDNVRVCGTQMVDVLILVCQGIYNGYKNSHSSITGLANEKELEKSRHPRFVPSEPRPHPRFKRNIVLECCLKTCTYGDLREYCY